MAGNAKQSKAINPLPSPNESRLSRFAWRIVSGSLGSISFRFGYLFDGIVEVGGNALRERRFLMEGATSSYEEVVLCGLASVLDHILYTLWVALDLRGSRTECR